MTENLSRRRLPFSFASHSSFTSTSCDLSICVSACTSVFFTRLWLSAKTPPWLQPSPPVHPPISSPADPAQLPKSRGRALSPTRRTSRQFEIYMKIHCRGKNRVCPTLTCLKVDIWFERLYSAAQLEVSEDAVEGIVRSSSGTVLD